MQFLYILPKFGQHRTCFVFTQIILVKREMGAYVVCAGNAAVIRNVSPSETAALILPLCADTIACAMDKPMPCPPVSELREASVL